jgi:hypothetical protein
MHCYKVLAFLLSVLMLGCNSSHEVSNLSKGISISGTVKVPYGMASAFRQPSSFNTTSDFFTTPFGTRQNGLETVDGVSVELIQVNSMGEQLGETLGTTVTEANGQYRLLVPANIGLSASLILRVSDHDDVQVRAQVVERLVDITPVSEFIVQSTLKSGLDLSVIDPSDIALLREKVGAFELAQSEQSDISTILSELEYQLGKYVKNELALMKKKASTADLAQFIAGNYQVTQSNNNADSTTEYAPHFLRRDTSNNNLRFTSQEEKLF